jgi:hypothetical protein
MARKPEIPAITSGSPEEILRVLRALRQRALIEDGVNADVADKKPTVQDLIDAGVTNAESIE